VYPRTATHCTHTHTHTLGNTKNTDQARAAPTITGLVCSKRHTHTHRDTHTHTHTHTLATKYRCTPLEGCVSRLAKHHGLGTSFFLSLVWGVACHTVWIGIHYYVSSPVFVLCVLIFVLPPPRSLSRFEQHRCKGGGETRQERKGCWGDVRVGGTPDRSKKDAGADGEFD